MCIWIFLEPAVASRAQHSRPLLKAEHACVVFFSTNTRCHSLQGGCSSQSSRGASTLSLSFKCEDYTLIKKKKSKKNKLEVGIAPCQRLGCECSPMHNLLKMKLRVLFTSALVCESSLVLLLRGNYSLDLIMCSLCTIVGPLEFTLREVF